MTFSWIRETFIRVATPTLDSDHLGTSSHCTKFTTLSGLTMWRTLTNAQLTALIVDSAPPFDLIQSNIENASLLGLWTIATSGGWKRDSLTVAVESTENLPYAATESENVQPSSAVEVSLHRRMTDKSFLGIVPGIQIRYPLIAMELSISGYKWLLTHIQLRTWCPGPRWNPIPFNSESSLGGSPRNTATWRLPKLDFSNSTSPRSTEFHAQSEWDIAEERWRHNTIPTESRFDESYMT